MAVAFGYFGIAGLINIPVGFRGVPLLVGGRLKGVILGEGWNWFPPRPFMAAEAIDIRERSTGVEKFTVLSQNMVRLAVDATVQWRVINPFQSLSVGEEVIDKGMLQLVRQVLRTAVFTIRDEDALAAHEALKDALSAAADTRAQHWGVDVVNVFIGSILPDQTVLEDYERVRREERQRDAERIELDHVRERLRELIALGYTPERAQEIVQTERGKVKKEINERQIVISSETGAILERIATAFAARFGR
ncbi:SPFH domain-containing protein [Candidatus Wolfebacteria bacterium]|nr:SPFH domain-containing protein [Candidatus Wolfebacteria bacterium]